MRVLVFSATFVWNIYIVRRIERYLYTGWA